MIQDLLKFDKSFMEILKDFLVNILQSIAAKAADFAALEITNLIFGGDKGAGEAKDSLRDITGAFNVLIQQTQKGIPPQALNNEYIGNPNNIPNIPTSVYPVPPAAPLVPATDSLVQPNTTNSRNTDNFVIPTNVSSIQIPAADSIKIDTTTVQLSNPRIETPNIGEGTQDSRTQRGTVGAQNVSGAQRNVQVGNHILPPLPSLPGFNSSTGFAPPTFEELQPKPIDYRSDYDSKILELNRLSMQQNPVLPTDLTPVGLAKYLLAVDGLTNAQIEQLLANDKALLAQLERVVEDFYRNQIPVSQKQDTQNLSRDNALTIQQMRTQHPEFYRDTMNDPSAVIQIGGQDLLNLPNTRKAEQEYESIKNQFRLLKESTQSQSNIEVGTQAIAANTEGTTKGLGALSNAMASVANIVGAVTGGKQNIGTVLLQAGLSAVSSYASGGFKRAFKGGTIKGFARGGTIPAMNVNQALNDALLKEKMAGGNNPQLVVASEGEEILSAHTKDAQLYRMLKESGQWSRMKNGDVANFVKGGTVGGNSLSSMYNNMGSTNNNTNSTNVNIVVNAKDANSFNQSKSQIEKDYMRQLDRAKQRNK